MAKTRWKLCSAAILATLAGCLSGPEPGNPIRVRPDMAHAAIENPVFVPQGFDGYAVVFDRTSDVITEYFDIAYSNRYDGRIETAPLVSAGCLDPGHTCASAYENWHSALQTIRRRAVVLITPADSGGYHIEVQVHKEIEDLPKPSHASAGAAFARPEVSLGRSYEVVDPANVSCGWIPIGRDCALEQEILCKLRKCL